jgi:hypothetical protein
MLRNLAIWQGFVNRFPQIQKGSACRVQFQGAATATETAKADLLSQACFCALPAMISVVSRP